MSFPVRIFLYLYSNVHYIYRIDAEGAEDADPEKRNWYQQIDKNTKYKEKWPVQLPKSKWDSEDEETSSASVAKEKIDKPANELHVSLNQRKCILER